MNYFNSTIQNKMGLCLDCKDSNEKILVAGRCSIHYSIHRKKIMLERQKEKSKFRSLIQSPGNKKVLEEKGIIKDNSLEAWFLLQMNVSERICDNCGISLNHYNINDWRGSMHHIVDKSPTNGCPSVACNPLNHLVLCKWKCHQIWHQSFEAASKMPVFSKAQEKFLLFQRFIAPDELRKVNPYLFQT